MISDMFPSEYLLKSILSGRAASQFMEAIDLSAFEHDLEQQREKLKTNKTTASWL